MDGRGRGRGEHPASTRPVRRAPGGVLCVAPRNVPVACPTFKFKSGASRHWRAHFKRRSYRDATPPLLLLERPCSLAAEIQTRAMNVFSGGN